MEEPNMQTRSSHWELAGEVIVPGNNQIGSKKNSLKINKNRGKKGRAEKEEDKLKRKKEDCFRLKKTGRRRREARSNLSHNNFSPNFPIFWKYFNCNFYLRLEQHQGYKWKKQKSSEIDTW